MTNHRLEALLAAVQGQNSLLILPHNDPDPDAIASAVALSHLLAQELKLETQVGYKGIIGRAENRALVRYLNHPLRHLAAAGLDPAVPIALIDTQPGTGNNPWQPELKVALVLDHHPWLETTTVAAFADVRSEVGATSTILFEYLMAAKVALPPPLATALFYGIKTDTRGLSRGTGSADAAAYFYLQSHIDGEAMAEIERAQVPAAYFKSFATTLESTRVYEGIAISYITSA
jgi:nanoRNase/pAp phosphatase (c-di-AMP/oligoRNAs hydrolase)